MLKNRFVKKMIFSLSIFLLAGVLLISCGTQSPIYGTWASNGGDLVILRDDGSCVYQIVTGGEGTYDGTYTVLLNTIYFSLPTGNFVYEWDIRDSILYLTFTDENNKLKGVSLYRISNS